METMPRKPVPPITRFMAKVGVRSASECWPWPTGKRPLFWDGERRALAYRFSYEWFSKSRIPIGMMACHSCDNPACVNPAHIFIGTCADNMADAATKGRMSSGEKHTGFQPKGEAVYCAVLTKKQAASVRRRYKPRHIKDGIRAMAREFGVSHTAIGHIVRGRNWKSAT